MSSAPLLASLALLAAAPPAPDLPARPEDLRFKPPAFRLPAAETYRHVLPGGVVVYLAEDHTLPLVDVTLFVRAGEVFEPGDRPGIAGLTASLLRSGGSAGTSPREIDDVADLLAARIEVEAELLVARASLHCLAANLEAALALFFQMLRSPAFDGERLKVAKDGLLADMAARDDDGGRVLEREWRWLLHGEGHPAARLATGAEIEAIRPEDLARFHAAWWHPRNLVVAAAGDLDPEPFLARLEQHLAGWPGPAQAARWPRPPERPPAPGAFRLDRDLPQTQVAIGHPGLARGGRWDLPAADALELLNEVLTGAGFASRLVRRLRSDEGLVYGVDSQPGVGTFWPGDFRVRFQAAPERAGTASRIVLAELARLRTEPVGAEELEMAKASLAARQQQAFRSPRETVRTFARDELLGRPAASRAGALARLQALTADDLLAAAREVLRPETAVVLVVGRWRGSDGDLPGLGPLASLPRRDPLTLRPAP